MAYSTKTILMVSTELDFLQAFITALCATDNRITCTTDDLAAQFADDSAYPTFTINFGGADNISFQRMDTANNTSSGYNVGSSRWGVTIKTYFDFSSSNLDKNRSSLRTWGFRVISGADMIFLDLYKYDNALLPYVQFGFMVGSDKATTWGNDGTERKLIKENYKLDGGVLVHKIDRIPYVYNSQNPAQIEKINGKVFNTSGIDQPTVKITSLIDCSTVPYGSWWTIDNKRYYALDEHTLMEV